MSKHPFRLQIKAHYQRGNVPFFVSLKTNEVLTVLFSATLQKQKLLFNINITEKSSDFISYRNMKKMKQKKRVKVLSFLF